MANEKNLSLSSHVGGTMKTINFLSHKGGVGKSTAAFHTAYGLPFVLPNGELSLEGGNSSHSRVLLVDLDEQCELSQRVITGYQSSPEYLAQNGYRTLLDFLTVNGSTRKVFKERLQECILHTDYVDIILGSYNGDKVNEIFSARPRLLKDRLALLSEDYDVCVLDSPPGRVAAQTAGIIASDYAFPCSDEQDGGITGVRDAINDINAINAKMDCDVVVSLIVVKKDAAPFDEEDWCRAKLKEITKVEATFLRYDPSLLREVARTKNLLYSYSQKTLAKQYAYFCVSIVKYLLKLPLRKPGYPPFTSFYKI